MNMTPDYPQVKELCEEIKNTSFKVKMRGYDPKEVDACMDEIVERLEAFEGGLEELRRHEVWLREELQAQVVSRAQQEARDIMQEAQDMARSLTENARADLAREQAEARERIRQEAAEWSGKKAALETELNALRQRADEYRTQSVRMLKEELHVLEQMKDGGAGKKPQPVPLHAETEINSVDDIDRMLTEIRKQVQ